MRMAVDCLVAVLLLQMGCSPSRKEVASHMQALVRRIQENPKEEMAIKQLISYLYAGENFTRTYAAACFKQLGPLGKGAVPDLIVALDSGIGALEREAALALGAIGPEAKNAVPALRRKVMLVDRDVGWFSADALASIGPEAMVAIEDLRRAEGLASPEWREFYTRAVLRLEAHRPKKSEQ